MPGAARQPFQYVVLRVVPRVERGERMNAGVVVFCPACDFLAARVALDERRLGALDAGAPAPAIAAHLEALRAIAAGEPGAGPIARLARSHRFHWLSAPASTVIQPSPIHTGLCDDPAAALDCLFARLVLPADGGL